MFSDATRSRFPQTHWVLLQRLADVIAYLTSTSAHPSAFPQTRNPKNFFNEYVDFSLAIYSTKLLQLYRATAHAIENEQYLVYAQCGRAILENIATLRYYSLHPDLTAASDAWKSRSLTDPILRKANETLDRLARGNRFAWEAFIEGRFDELTKTPHQEHLAQVNSATCLQKWFKDSPKLEPLYDLFCDLVHPNLGSNLLVLAVSESGLVAGGTESHSTAIFIVAPTLAGLLGAFKTANTAMATLSSLRLLPIDGAHVH